MSDRVSQSHIPQNLESGGNPPVGENTYDMVIPRTKKSDFEKKPTDTITPAWNTGVKGAVLGTAAAVCALTGGLAAVGTVLLSPLMAAAGVYVTAKLASSLFAGAKQCIKDIKVKDLTTPSPIDQAKNNCLTAAIICINTRIFPNILQESLKSFETNVKNLAGRDEPNSLKKKKLEELYNAVADIYNALPSNHKAADKGEEAVTNKMLQIIQGQIDGLDKTTHQGVTETVGLPAKKTNVGQFLHDAPLSVQRIMGTESNNETKIKQLGQLKKDITTEYLKMDEDQARKNLKKYIAVQGNIEVEIRNIAPNSCNPIDL